MWIQLKAIKQVSENGRDRTFYPGDWVNVGRQIALQWIERGDAVQYVQTNGVTLGIDGAGIIVTNGDPVAVANQLSLLNVIVESGGYTVSFPYTLFVDVRAKVNAAMVVSGFNLLKHFEMAIPLFDYNVLARDVGSDSERSRTEKIVHDLRIPLYCPYLIFARQTPLTETIMREWRRDVEAGDHEMLSLTRTIYQHPLIMLALPATWIRGEMIPAK